MTDGTVLKPTSGIGPIDPRIDRALAEIPRAGFLSTEVAGHLYDNRHGPIPEGHALIPSPVLARMLQGLGLTPTTRVWVVSAGEGYIPAIVARLVREVVTFVDDPVQADIVRKNLADLGVTNVEIIIGDPFVDRAQFPPFGAILVPRVGMHAARALRRHLLIGGRLVLPTGTQRLYQVLVRVTRRGQADYTEDRIGEVGLVSRIGDLLSELGILDPAVAARISHLALKSGTRAGDLLRDSGGVAESDIYFALAIQRGLKFGGIDTVAPTVNLEFVRSFPRRFLEHRQVIPVTQDDRRVTLAIADPDHLPQDMGQVFHPRRIELVLMTPTDHRRLWTSVDLMLQGKVVVPPAAPSPDAAVPEIGREEEARFIRLFDTLLMEAVVERASDIHLERYGDRVRLRIRVDGDLRDLTRYQLTPIDAIGLINVIKIRSDLDIAERRLPQGGRIRVRLDGGTFDLRVQTQPTLHGEHAVIRILPQGTKLLTIEDLGLAPHLAEAYRRLLDSPSGMVLVVGPTGSGKSTTLYAGLQILAQDSSRKVITVEDPIEYSIENVQQSAARPEIGFGFPDAMRAFVREDPDVILVGEIRDGETALEAIRASQTGHLVFSTLHCNDTTDAVQRLLDLGMHPNSIGSEMLAVISQRLAKRICDNCRVPSVPDERTLREVFPEGLPPGFKCFKGAGCSKCGGFGTKGRVACVEFLRANSALRNAISRRMTVEDFRALAMQSGLITMRSSALEMVAAGTIRFEELRVILQEERLHSEETGAAPVHS